MMQQGTKGFTLLELLLVIGILVILAGAGVAYYRNSVKGIEADETGKVIVGDLRDARSRALYGQDRMNWGLRFVNSSTPSTYYYQMFETPTIFSDASTTVVATTYLPGVINFKIPGSGTSTDIIFGKIVGTIATTTSIVINLESTDITITATPIGNITKSP